MHPRSFLRPEARPAAPVTSSTHIPSQLRHLGLPRLHITSTTSTWSTTADGTTSPAVSPTSSSPPPVLPRSLDLLLTTRGVEPVTGSRPPPRPPAGDPAGPQPWPLPPRRSRRSTPASSLPLLPRPTWRRCCPDGEVPGRGGTLASGPLTSTRTRYATECPPDPKSRPCLVL